MIAAPLPRRLLILACSATKRPDLAPLPARDRYDGPLWRTLRAADPCSRRARVAFLSARFGFRAARTLIEDYDARLSEDLASRMIAGGMATRWPCLPSPSRPDNYGMHPGAEIASLTRYGAEPIGDVALAGGHLYLAVMRAMLEGFVDMGCVDADAHVVEINEPIGRMRRELRRWLLGGGPGRGRPAMTDRDKIGHNGGPPLDELARQRHCMCKHCAHWKAPPESEQRAYETSASASHAGG